MRKLLQKILFWRARAVIRKFEPTVIAITGSVGKTGAKHAVFDVVSERRRARTAEKNYNNEFGVPLTILGEASPGKSPLGWLRLLWRSFFVKDLPEILVLEYGIDKPGDMAELCSIAKPDIAVVTGISPVHAEFFADINELVKEKVNIFSHVKQDGLCIINTDSPFLRPIASALVGSVKTYGVKEADLCARDIRVHARKDDHYDPDELFATTTAYIETERGVIGELVLQNALGYAPVMSCLVALLVCERLGIPTVEAIRILNRKVHANPGRLNPLAGVKGSLIIDDSYNAAPAAMKNGLEILSMFTREKGERRVAVLGSMAELGQYREEEHRRIGEVVAEVADVFIAVGEGMKFAVESAREKGFPEDRVYSFATSKEAASFIENQVESGDIIYVKGAQSSRMERVVKALMAEPDRAEELLVRQSEAWLTTE